MPQSIFEEGTYVTNLIQHLLLFIAALRDPGSVTQDSFKDELNKDSLILEHEILHLFTGLRVCSCRLWFCLRALTHYLRK